MRTEPRPESSRAVPPPDLPECTPRHPTPLGFSLFRDIPLWRLYTYSAAGTVLGGLLAALVGMGPIVGAFGGLAAALGLLRLRARYHQ